MSILDVGIDNDIFVRDYFEKNFLFRKKILKKSIISFDEINQIVYAWDSTDPMLKMHYGGKVLSPGEYMKSYQDVEAFRTKIDPERFVSLLNNGATLLLNRLERKSQAVGELCYEISQFVDELAVANGYVAFGGEGTFGKHWDTHDVFAVQLLGRKYWKVYEPTYPLPLPGQSSKNHKHECPLAPVFDGVLEAGDMLYLPRGWWHEAIPIENEPTVHVAVGLHTAKTVDYISWIVEQKLPNLLPARVGIGKSFDNANAIKMAADALISDINNSAYLDEFMDKMGKMTNSHNIDFLPNL